MFNCREKRREKKSVNRWKYRVFEGNFENCGGW